MCALKSRDRTRSDISIFTSLDWESRVGHRAIKEKFSLSRRTRRVCGDNVETDDDESRAQEKRAQRAGTPVIRQCRGSGSRRRRGMRVGGRGGWPTFEKSHFAFYTGLTPKTRAADLWTSILNGSWNCLIFHVRQRVHGAERISEGSYTNGGRRRGGGGETI